MLLSLVKPRQGGVGSACEDQLAHLFVPRIFKMWRSNHSEFFHHEFEYIFCIFFNLDFPKCFLII